MGQPAASAFADTPLTLDQVKAAGYTDAPLDSAHPWTATFPKTAAVVRSSLNALPGIGGIVGGVIATPESAGLATVPGVALGVGVGRGLRDLIAEGLGLDRKSSAGEKGTRIALDVGEAAVAQSLLPGLMEAIRTPGRTVREVLSLLPERFRPPIPEGLARAPAAILQRPSWQTWEEYLPKPTPPPASTPGATSTAWSAAPMTAREAQAASARPGSASGGTAPLAGPPAAAAPVSTPPPGPPVAAPSKAMLSSSEVLEFDRLRAAGKTEAQAWNTIRAAREIREKFGLKIPSKAETKFPKGNRGGSPRDE